MPIYTFNDSEPKVFELWPTTDYIGEVIACEFTIRNSGKTNGSDQMGLTIRFTRKNPTTGAPEQKDIEEDLIFHPSTDWKIDLFAKSYNLLIEGKPPAKGQPIDWNEQMVVGLRGWTTLGFEEYVAKRDKSCPKCGEIQSRTGVFNCKCGMKLDIQLRKINKIIAFITNKEKLAKVAEAPAPQDDFGDENVNPAF